MPAPAAYRPDETDKQIFSEHTWLQGAFLAAVAYGMQVILYSMSCYLLVRHRTSTNSTKNIGLTVYITILFTLGTLYIAALLQFTQESFIDGRNIPGGADAYEKVMFSSPIDMLGNVTMVILTWMCDIINVWRCIVIYQGSRVPVWIVSVVPFTMYLASIVLGILFLKQIGSGTQTPWQAHGINYTSPYYSMSLALNILVTIMIVTRLFLCRHRINRVMGRSHGTQYTYLAAMIIESAAIYSTFSLLFLVPFAFQNPLSQLFLQALSPVQNVSTFLIIFRVAQGKGWTQETINATTVTTIGSAGSPIRIHAVKSVFTDADLGRENTAIFAKRQSSAPSVELAQLKKVRTTGSQIP
ncbi:hypothetical protein BDZ94DRAFT_1174538 [Collybia nuda]|uniref:Uncharacterized protein n=1 Tax=Collybia nuda TaxID=64659 RepID=A0A9P6CEH0_9AGAR|nr:hypothetical protein BDZ94DRAFT_1174538 [Collybia nuda]